MDEVAAGQDCSLLCIGLTTLVGASGHLPKLPAVILELKQCSGEY